MSCWHGFDALISCYILSSAYQFPSLSEELDVASQYMNCSNFLKWNNTISVVFKPFNVNP